MATVIHTEIKRILSCLYSPLVAHSITERAYGGLYLDKMYAWLLKWGYQTRIIYLDGLVSEQADVIKAIRLQVSSAQEQISVVKSFSEQNPMPVLACNSDFEITICQWQHYADSRVVGCVRWR